MSRSLSAIVLLHGLLLVAPEAHAEKDQFVHVTPGGVEQPVFVGFPNDIGRDHPVVFVMHGVRRNADEYRDQWLELAERHGFLLVVPEFSDAAFPGAAGYNLGNVYDEEGTIRPRADWAFAAIDPLFDAVRTRYRVTAEHYSIYGHSAGAQFVHRFLMHVPEARVARAVAANAGWYTMPDFNVALPYGLQGSAVSEGDLNRALRQPLTILLGEADTDPDDPNLRRTDEAMEQGPHRLYRGRAFYEAALIAAGQAGVALNWNLVTVPEVGHDNARMAPAAVPFLARLKPQADNPD